MIAVGKINVLVKVFAEESQTYSQRFDNTYSSDDD